MAVPSGPTSCTRGRRSLAASARPPRRGVHELHTVFRFRLSPKAAKNPDNSESDIETSGHSVQEPDTDTLCRKPLARTPRPPAPPTLLVSGRGYTASSRCALRVSLWRRATRRVDTPSPTRASHLLTCPG